MPPLIAPSMLSADFSRLADELKMIEGSEAEWVHLDVMDGHFVPNLTFGPPVIKAIRPHSSRVFDVHLMIEQPDRYLEAFRDAGADYLTVHVEACTHLHRTLARIRELGMRPGVALNPHTPVAQVRDVLCDLDLLLIMSVNPGFGGQQFIPRTYARVREAVELIDSMNCDFLIEVDGGVTLANARPLIEAGVNVLVAGNTVFTAEDPVSMIERLRNA
ncbi:MAG TPA: ribulose-phosphate 3-epimerase [Bacteroidales bacterium]|nr:ribulose-phosphate 3-epimerase [Bacteroidales bacterium]